MVGKGLIHICSERKAVCMQSKYNHECVFSTTWKNAVERMPIFTAQYSSAVI